MNTLNEFLRHLAAGDLPHDELMRLKAEAFEACAVEATSWGDLNLAAACDVAAERARRQAEGCDGCRTIGPLLIAPGTSGRSWRCGACGHVWQRIGA